MIIKISRYGFKQVKYILEPVPDIGKLIEEYSRIFILNHEKADFPGFVRRHKKTPIINLLKSEEGIFNNFNSTARNEIRRSEKIQELKFITEDDNFKDVYKVYAGHEKSQGRNPDKKDEFAGCKIFSAYYKEEMISVVICFYGSGYLRAKSISSKRHENIDKDLLKMISFSSRRLIWEICRYGKKNGYIGFDLGSVNLTDTKKKGIAGFKQSFGAEIKDEYTYIYKSKLFKFIQKLIK